MANLVGFRSTARLVEHYEKHGREFGSVSQTQYLQLAQQLREAPVGGDIVEVVRQSDGVISRFDRASGAFLAADPDGTIVPLLWQSNADGSSEWVPATDVGLSADLPRLVYDLETLDRGTELYVELSVTDYGGNDDFVSAYATVP